MNKKLQIPSWVWKIMKISSLQLALIALCCGVAHAYPANSQGIWEKNISIQANDLRFVKVLSLIEEQANVRFIYSPSAINVRQKVTVSVTNKKLDQVLQEVLSPLSIAYSVANDRILLKRAIPKPPILESTELEVPLLEELPDRKVEGRVIDENGEGLPGVSVLVKDTQSGVITDAEGNFSISIPSDDAILVFSFVGYISQEVVVGNRSNLVVQLEVDNKALEEVVVVGYGTQKRRDVTGAIASVPKDRLEMVPSINIAQALQGSVPGVVVQQSQGGANPQSTIVIRGRNSILASNDPLIILDGIPYNGNLSDINVNEVASIEVLKDASSTAIYGSRGANGVIIVTTKLGGSKNKTPRFSYDGKYSFQRPNNMPRFMSPEEFYDFKEKREPGLMTPSEQSVYDNKSWTNWADDALRNGKATHHNLSLDGGFNETDYYLSGNFLKVEGQTLNDEYTRFNGRVGIRTTLAKFIKIGANLQVASADYGGAPIDWEDVLKINPLTSGYDANGNRQVFPWPEFIDILNPLDPLNYEYSHKSFQLFSNNYAEINIPKVNGLTYRVNFGYQKNWSSMSNYADRTTGLGYTNQGYHASSNGENDYVSLENIVTYRKKFGDHSLDFTGVYSFEEGNRHTSTLEARGFAHDFITKYSVAQANFKLPGYDYYKTVLIGQMLRLNYNYDGRYLFTFTGRRDGYSGFGANRKWGIFPSIALGWNLAEEQWGLQDIFQEFKFRASYGVNGNQAVGAYETISRLGEDNMVSGSNSLPGYVPIKLGQDELGWESSRTLNLGLDFSLLKGAVSGTINYYNTDTYDLLLNRTISPVHGISNITQNIGKTNNRGVEASLTTVVRGGNGLRWDLQGNMAVNKNKIVALYGLLDDEGNEIDDLANSWFIGQPISVNYNYKYLGVWQLNEAEEAQKFGSRPGNAKAYDADGDSRITPDDRIFLGQRDPSFTWGLTNTLSYKSFGLTVFFHGIHGMTRLNELLNDNSTSAGARRNVIKKNWWTPENPSNDFPENSTSAVTYPIYEDASFVRLKDVTLSYSVKSQVASKLGLDNLRFYVNLRNMLTWSEWSTNDPELQFGRGAAPLAKEFVLGINFSF